MALGRSKLHNAAQRRMNMDEHSSATCVVYSKFLGAEVWAQRVAGALSGFRMQVVECTAVTSPGSGSLKPRSAVPRMGSPRVWQAVLFAVSPEPNHALTLLNLAHQTAYPCFINFIQFPHVSPQKTRCNGAVIVLIGVGEGIPAIPRPHNPWRMCPCAVDGEHPPVPATQLMSW